MNIDRLVTKVNSLPLLWNSFDIDYKDRNKKEIAWITVAESVLEKYAIKDEMERKF